MDKQSNYYKAAKAVCFPWIEKMIGLKKGKGYILAYLKKMPWLKADMPEQIMEDYETAT